MVPSLLIYACLAFPFADPAPAGRTLDAGIAALDDVVFGGDESGNLFAVGGSWKMRFSAAGARYVPVLGSRAPRSLPLDFRLRGAAPAPFVRDGDRVTFDRGSVVEIYALAPRQVEQSFLLRARPAGDRLVLDVVTELAFGGRDAEGLRFEAPALATVRYGNVTAIDRAGRRATFAPEFAQGAIVLALPDAFAARAEYPVVVDPVLTTILVDGGADVAEDPDVAYADTVNVFQVSYEKVISASDSDILTARYNTSGTFLDLLALDVSDEDSEDPAVAFTSPHFVTAWTDGDAGPGGRRVRARARVAGSTGLGSAFTVSPALQSGESDVDVGGGEHGTTLVVWHGREFADANGFDIKGRLVNAAGTVGGGFNVKTGEHYSPRVSSEQDAQGRWCVVHEHLGSAFQTPIAIDAFASLVDEQGDVGSAQLISPGNDAGQDKDPCVVFDGSRFVIAFVRDTGTADFDLFLRTLTPNSGVNPGTLGTLLNFSNAVMGAGETGTDQEPELMFDGVRLVLAHATNSDRFATTFQFNGSLVVHDAMQPLANDSFGFDRIRGASAGLDAPGKHFVVWDRFVTSSDVDAQGVLFTSLATGGVEILQTGCGGTGFEPIVITSSIPALGNTCHVTLFGFHAALIAFGPPNVTPACPGSPCQFGVFGTTYVATTDPTFSFTVGTSAALLGDRLAFQGLDFLPDAAAPQFCVSAGQRFTTSDTIVFTIQ